MKPKVPVRPFCLVTLLAVLLTPAHEVLSDVLVWNNPQGGSFDDKNNWSQPNGGSQNHVPGGGDVACIGGGQEDICGAGGAASVSGLISVSGGSVDTLNLRFATFSLAGTFSASHGQIASAIVAGSEDATLSFNNLTLFQTTLNGPKLQVNGEGTFSELTVSSGAVFSDSATLGNAASTLDGVSSSWDSGPLSDTSASGLTIQNEAQMTSANVDVTHSSLFTVTGHVSTWRTGPINVGSAKFTIADGGHVFSDEAQFGVGSGASSDIAIDGISSIWGFNGKLDIGFSPNSSARFNLRNGTLLSLENNAAIGVGGNGAINIQSGSQLRVSGGEGVSLSLGVLPGAEGNLSVDGEGSFIKADSFTSIGVKGTGALTVSGGATAQITADCVLGGLEAGQGSLSATGTKSEVEIQQLLIVGDEGSGTLSVSRGGTIRCFGAGQHTVVGNAPKGTGAISISDPGSQLDTEGPVTVGGNGTATVGITFGGKWQSSRVELGSVLSSSVDVQVFGTNSYWDNAGTIFVGGTPADQPVGVATIGVNNSAVVASSFGLTLSSSGGVTVGPSGYIVVGGGGFGPPGTLQVNQDGTLAGKGTVHGRVSIASGGTLQPGFEGYSRGIFSIDGDFQQDIGATLKIEVDGLNPGQQHDLLVVTGNTTLAGNLVMDFANAFAPKAGDAVGFLRHGTSAIAGQFSTIQITGVSTNFQYKLQDQSGILSLVAVNSPEPTSPPVLTISSSGSQIQITWPAAATAYTLQSSSDVASQAWQDEGATSSTISVQPSAKARFYRLKKP